MQLKDRSISEVRGALRALTSEAKKVYNANKDLMTLEFATSAHNMSLSLPDLAHITGWNKAWDPHVLPVTPAVIEAVVAGMASSASQDEGIQALLRLVKKEKE
jgi:hypothetical protein